MDAPAADTLATVAAGTPVSWLLTHWGSASAAPACPATRNPKLAHGDATRAKCQTTWTSPSRSGRAPRGPPTRASRRSPPPSASRRRACCAGRLGYCCRRGTAGRPARGAAAGDPRRRPWAAIAVDPDALTPRCSAQPTSRRSRDSAGESDPRAPGGSSGRTSPASGYVSTLRAGRAKLRQSWASRLRDRRHRHGSLVPRHRHSLATIRRCGSNPVRGGGSAFGNITARTQLTGTGRHEHVAGRWLIFDTVLADGMT